MAKPSLAVLLSASARELEEDVSTLGEQPVKDRAAPLFTLAVSWTLLLPVWLVGALLVRFIGQFGGAWDLLAYGVLASIAVMIADFTIKAGMCYYARMAKCSPLDDLLFLIPIGAFVVAIILA